MTGSQGIQFLFSPFCRMIFTFTPAQMQETFNLTVESPIFLVGTVGDTLPAICRDTESAERLINSSESGLVEISRINLNRLKSACISAGLLELKQNELTIRGNETTLKLPTHKDADQKQRRSIYK